MSGLKDKSGTTRACATPTNPRLSYLDGLRGWAALVVIVGHLLPAWLLNETILDLSGRHGLLDFVNMTPLAILLDGNIAVYLFFCISGAALSYPILTSERPLPALIDMAAFRYPRLTIPIIFSCAFAYCLLALGLIENAPAAAQSHSYWLSLFYGFPPRFDHLVRFVFWDVYFNYGGPTSWNSVLWTMPIEIKGSFIVFALLAIGRGTPFRIGLEIIGALCFFHSQEFGFFSGLMIAEGLAIARKRQVAAPYATAAGIAAMLVGVAMATLARWPAAMHAPRAILLSYEGRNTTATLLLLGVVTLAPARRIFSLPISKYFGRISFGLYLVHTPIICSFSSALYLSLTVRFALPFFAVTAIVFTFTLGASILAAELFCRTVDESVLIHVKTWLRGAITALAASRSIGALWSSAHATAADATVDADRSA